MSVNNSNVTSFFFKATCHADPEFEINFAGFNS